MTRRKQRRNRVRSNFYRRYRGVLRVVQFADYDPGPLLHTAHVWIKAPGRRPILRVTDKRQWVISTATIAGIT